MHALQIPHTFPSNLRTRTHGLMLCNCPPKWLLRVHLPEPPVPRDSDAKKQALPSQQRTEEFDSMPCYLYYWYVFAILYLYNAFGFCFGDSTDMWVTRTAVYSIPCSARFLYHHHGHPDHFIPATVSNRLYLDWISISVVKCSRCTSLRQSG